jgi:5-methylcytosine-specific restriction endonuclease McrA
MDFMLRHLLEQFTALALKDNQRDFTYPQRLAVFRRDSQTCMVKLKCKGVKVEWDDWHCDHKLAWVMGGQTTVDNGQVACPACNLAKGAG